MRFTHAYTQHIRSYDEFKEKLRSGAEPPSDNQSLNEKILKLIIIPIKSYFYTLPEKQQLVNYKYHEKIGRLLAYVYPTILAILPQ